MPLKQKVDHQLPFFTSQRLRRRTFFFLVPLMMVNEMQAIPFSLCSNSSASLQVGELRQVWDGKAKESGLQALAIDYHLHLYWASSGGQTQEELALKKTHC